MSEIPAVELVNLAGIAQLILYNQSYRLRYSPYVALLLALLNRPTDNGVVTREDIQTLKNDWLTDNVSDASW